MRNARVTTILVFYGCVQYVYYDTTTRAVTRRVKLPLYVARTRLGNSLALAPHRGALTSAPSARRSAAASRALSAAAKLAASRSATAAPASRTPNAAPFL